VNALFVAGKKLFCNATFFLDKQKRKAIIAQKQTGGIKKWNRER